MMFKIADLISKLVPCEYVYTWLDNKQKLTDTHIPPDNQLPVLKVNRY